MIGVAHETTEAAVDLALKLETARLLGDDVFAEVRAEAVDALRDLGWDDIVLPPTKETYREVLDSIVLEVGLRLADERAHLGGDTVALPLFLLNVHAFDAALGLAFNDEIDEWRHLLLQRCLDDLWLDREELLDALAAEVRWISVQEEGEDATVRLTELFRATFGWLERVVGAATAEDDTTLATARELSRELADFQAEVREQGQRLAELVRAGDAETRAILEEVEHRLVEQGLSPETAAQLTVGDPAGFWERVIRWGRSDSARDTAEEVLWVVLDFVPGGTGVKLGVKVARAVRKATKKEQQR